jgi:hypothetical protein
VNIINPSGGGSGRWKIVNPTTRGTNLADADAAIDVSDGGWFVLPDSTLGGNRTLTIDDTYATIGARMTITRLDVEAYTYQIDNGGGGGGTIVTMPISDQAFLDVEFDGTDWILKRYSQI